MQKNFFSPAEIAENFLDIGKAKASLSAYKQFVLGIMAGIFIALASQGTNQVSHAISSAGIGRTLGGVIFTCGLMMVVVGGGELFTGNCLMIIACIKRKITVKSMLRSWLFVYLGNLAGSLLMALFIFKSGQLNFTDGMLGAFSIKIAVYKTELSFEKAFFMGILCNILVCLAVWMASAAKDVSGKILAIFFPIWLTAASGFEHIVADMYYVPIGILAKSNPLWVSEAIKLGVTHESINALGWGAFLLRNLIPVTFGNAVGGIVLVGLTYCLVYLRKDI